MDSSAPYVPRDPRSGVLHPLVSEWWPKYVESAEAEGGSVPGFVVRGVERYLNCGVPEAGFIRLRCLSCGIYRALAFSCAGLDCPPPPPSVCIEVNYDDGTELICDAIAPRCPPGEVVAVRRGCFQCLDAHTCQ